MKQKKLTNSNFVGLLITLTLVVVTSTVFTQVKGNPAAAAAMLALDLASSVSELCSIGADTSQKSLVIDINIEGLAMVNGLTDCYYISDADTTDKRRTWLVAPPTFCGKISFEIAVDNNNHDNEIALRYFNLQDANEIVFKVKWHYSPRTLCVYLADSELLCVHDWGNEPQFKTMEEQYQTLTLLGETFKSNCYGGFDLANSYPDTGVVYCNVLPHNNRYNYVMELTGHNNCYFNQDLANFILIDADSSSERHFENMGLNSAWFKVYCNGQYLFDIRNYRHNFKFSTTGEGLVFHKTYDVGSTIRYTAYEDNKSITCVTTKTVLRNMYTLKNSCKVMGLA